MAENGHNHAGMWVFPNAAEITSDMAERTRTIPGPFKWALAVAGLFFVLGVIGFVARAMSDGFDDYTVWGYYATSFFFVFMVTSAAPLAAVTFRFTKSHWRRPLTRVSELFAVVGVINTILFIPLLLVMPPINNTVGGEHTLEIRRTIWFEVPIGAPLWWDMLGVAFLGVTSLAILWLTSMPDLAESRSTSTGLRRTISNLLAGHWYGSKRQWEVQKAGIAILGAFYFMFLIYVHFILTTDYAQSLVPGWKDSIFPPLYSLTSFQASLGLVLVVLYVMRRWCGYENYIGISTFWSASKLMLAFTLLWAYHTFAFFITYWFGRLEVEQNIIKYFFVQSYGAVFVANFVFTFAVPFLILLWNPVRKTAWGPTLAGISALVGAFLFNLRIFVGSFNAGDIYGIGLDHVPPPVYPDLWDILMLLGGIGAAALVYLAATKVIPILSVWEVKEGTMYQSLRTFVRGEYLVLAKPE